MLVPIEDADQETQSSLRSPSPSVSFTYSESTCSVKSNLKRKNLENDEDEPEDDTEQVVRPKSNHSESSKHKIKTRSQTARELSTNRPSTSSKLSKRDAIVNVQEETVLEVAGLDNATEAWLTTFREWNSKNKLSALEHILELCEHSHIKHVHNFIEPKLQRDYISELPKELVLLLLTYVRPKDLFKLPQVSHYWHQTANDTILWKNICKRKEIDLDNLYNNTSMVLNDFTENNFRKTSNSETQTDKNPNTNPNDSDSETTNPFNSNIPTIAGYISPSSPSSSHSSEPTKSIKTLPITEPPIKNTRPSRLHHHHPKPTSSSSKKRKSTSSQTKIGKLPMRGIIASTLPYFNNTISRHTLLSCTALKSLVKTPLNTYLEKFNPYKRAYLIDYNVTRNWCARPLPKPFVLRSHDEHVITCLKFDGFRVVSGSDDCTLKVWCALTGKLLQTLVGHTGGVWASQLKDNIVISGSTDRSVRVWNIDTGECIHVLTGHTSTVRCLALHNSIVISGSRDSLLRVWNIETGHCMQILRGHVAAVRCVCFDGKYVVSGSYDFTIRVWDPFRNECLHVLEGHSNRVYSLLFEGDRIVSGSLDTTIIVWNVHTGTIIHKLIGHHSLTSGMQIKNDILVSGNADSTVKIWSLTTGDCLHTLAGNNKHMSAVTCLSFNEKFVVSSSDDGTVKLWNVETGEFIRNLLGLDSGGRGGVVWRISMHKNKLVCAVGSRIGVEETKLILLDFDWPPLQLTEKTESDKLLPVITAGVGDNLENVLVDV